MAVDLQSRSFDAAGSADTATAPAGAAPVGR